MLFNVFIEETGSVRFSPAPGVDKLTARIESTLYPGLPLEALERYLGEDLSAEGKNITSKSIALASLQKEVIRRVERGLKKDGSFLGDQLVWQSSSNHEELIEDELLADFLQMLEGRQLAEGEIIFLAKRLNLNQDKMIKLMHRAVSCGKGKWVPALHREGSAWHCQRCGSYNYQEWPSIYGQEATCLDCQSIGALSSLHVLFRLEPSKESCSHGVVTSMPSDFLVEFSDVQQQAAEKLLRYAGDQKAGNVLIWAACGAGKTEVCFPLLRKFLGEGKRVLFAAPRQDVVHDIHPRLQKNFPQYQVGIWSGACNPECRLSQLTVATTHQILKFYQAFDLILFDEMDAYPYLGNKVLEYGIAQALRKDGQMVYLSATPSENLLEQVRNRACQLITLPARFHRHPIPIPEVIKIKLPEYDSTAEQIRQSHCIPALGRIVEELTREGPILIFVPQVDMVKEWAKAFSQIFSCKKVEGSWSSDPDRRRKVSDLMAGRSDIFVCTSILERGITINSVQVLILYAQDKLYDVRTLVQMAGRTGRTTKSPFGRTLFIAPKETRSINESIQWIKQQNSLAGEGGFLDD